jgi:hypothetical protein
VNIGLPGRLCRHRRRASSARACRAAELDAASAIEQLKQGAISAAMIVGGKPSALVSAIPVNAGIRLLPIPSAFLLKRPICRRGLSLRTIPI